MGVDATPRGVCPKAVSRGPGGSVGRAFPEIRITRFAVATVLLCAVLAGCSSSSGNNAVPTPQGIDRSPLLTQVTSCGQLETAIEDALVLEMKSGLEQIRKSDYFIGEGGLPVGGPVGMNGPVAAPSGAGGPTSVSTTNTQVAGVDEADFVQNDGTRIAVLAGGMLHLLRSWPPAGHGRGREPEDRRLASGDVPRRRPGGGLQQRLRSARHRGQSPHLCSGGRRCGRSGRGGRVLRLLGERRHPDRPPST